jgi:tetratricopeptide (TPR) repeat protein
MKATSDLMTKAVKYHQSGKLDKAEVLYRKVLRQSPTHADALHLLGVIAQQRGKHDEAIALINKAIGSSPANITYYFNLANVYHTQGRLDLAERAYRDVIKINPVTADAYNNLGVVLNQAGRMDEAAAAYAQALQINPGFIDATLNQGALFHRLNRVDEAVATYQRVLQLKPAYAKAWFYLGNVYKDQQDWIRAIDAYKHALDINKDYGEAYCNIGLVFLHLNNFDNALVAFRHAHRLRPDDVTVCLGLGDAFEGLCNFDEAIKAYRQGLDIDPGAREGFRKLGRTYYEVGDLDLALQVYTDMLKSGVDDVDALINTGHVLSAMGEFSRAEDAFHQALKIRPDCGGAYNLLSLIKKFSADDADKVAMEGLIQRPDLNEESRMFLCFALAKACEDCKEFDRSFQYLLEGNRLHRQSFKYDVLEDETRFAMIKATFSAEFFINRRDYGVQDATPIFIVGMPRSGTSLVEQILSSHPDVAGAGELYDLKQLVFKVVLKAENIIALGNEDAVRLADEYLRRLTRYRDGAEHVTDKMPGNYVYIGMIRLMFPQAKIIHCLRNPADNCVSIFQQFFSGVHMYAYDLKELGQYYHLYRGLMDHWHRVLPGYIHDIEYESLVAEQESETRRLLEFCGLPWDDACLSFYKSDRKVQTVSLSQVRQPIYKRSMQKWRQYEQYLGPLLEALEDGHIS